MWKYLNYFNATAKVFYDKSTDYLLYYIGLNNDDNNEFDSIGDDVIEDYDGVLKIESYENENNSVRIYPMSSLYDEYSTFYGNPTHIVDGIYLGSAFNAASFQTLKTHNIKVIINATSEISNYYPSDFLYLRYPLYDNNKNRIKQYLEDSYNDIIKHQKQTRVIY